MTVPQKGMILVCQDLGQSIRVTNVENYVVTYSFKRHLYDARWETNLKYIAMTPDCSDFIQKDDVIVLDKHTPLVELFKE